MITTQSTIGEPEQQQQAVIQQQMNQWNLQLWRHYDVEKEIEGQEELQGERMKTLCVCEGSLEMMLSQHILKY